MTPSHRTRTGTQTIFNLSHPHPVVYNFTDISTDGLKITVPPYSPWICRAHWHETAPACETLAPIEGHFIIYDNFVFTPGSGIMTGNGQNPPTFVMPLKIDLQVQWERNPNADPGEAVVFSLKAANEAYEFYGFYRQLCSVNQDAEMYFQLPSTPLWLRAMYAFWGWMPFIGARIRAWLVASLLWVQLRVIYSRNDYLENEGYIPYTRPWRYVPAPVHPPKKWADRELRSVVTISKLVLKVCHWVGTKVLGMEAKYEEYEVDIADSVWVDKKDDLL
ncbi:hypothetical protein DL95DRAFT_380827 [Leptodontidium sp. 2 PMI_412]|nr:hypothetical protein DL95DRAFT_380827 [Leptodontidium sp. 2 PMI_412]